MGKNNKRNQISRMSLAEILNEVDLILREKDIIHFCKDKEIINQFIDMCTGKVNKVSDIRKFFIDNAKSIDKEKFVLLIIKNYQDNLKLIEEEINMLIKNVQIVQSQEKIIEVARLRAEAKVQKEKIEKLKYMSRGMNQILTVYYYDDERQMYDVEVVDSRKVVDGKIIENKENIKRFEKVDNFFKGDNPSDNELGLEFVLQSMMLTDLYYVFPTEDYGDGICTSILENDIVKRGIKTREELDELKSIERYSEYIEVLNAQDDNTYTEILPQIKNTLKAHAGYLDIEKLLLISAYRFKESLEKGDIDEKNHINVQEVLAGILENIKEIEDKKDKKDKKDEKDKNFKISFDLEHKIENGYERRKVEYSVNDIKKNLKQFTSTKYISDSEVKEYKEKVYNGEKHLLELDQEYIDVIFSKDDLERVSTYSEHNLIYVLKNNNWNSRKILDTIIKMGSCSEVLFKGLLMTERISGKHILELYENKLITLEYIEGLKEFINIDESMTFEKINSYYKKAKQNPKDEELKNMYKNYTNLYKELFIKDKTQGEIEASANIVAGRILENFNSKEYKQVILDYYNQGLITLGAIIEWNDKSFITQLLDDGIITLEDIKLHEEKLGFEYMNNIYLNLVNNSEIDYDERIAYIEKGYITVDNIEDLYNKNMILDEDLLSLSKKGIISEELANKLIENRSLEDRIRNARAKITGWNDEKVFDINSLQKIHTPSVPNFTGVEGKGKEKILIDPNVRQEYIEKLGLYRVNIKCDQDHPFYNYEFYATPDEEGNIGPNSVIIAERYYKNKNTEKSYATDNATYFFRYKDFLVLSNLNKVDMMKERENIVFRANHTLTTSKRKGTWAQSVLYSFLKTTLSSDLKDLSEKQKRQKLVETMRTIYLKEECDEIFKLCEQIDSGEFNCYAKERNTPNFDDDDNER